MRMILSYLRYVCVMLLLFVIVVWCRIKMVGGIGRNDAAIAKAMIVMTQVLDQAQGNAGHGQQD